LSIPVTLTAMKYLPFDSVVFAVLGIPAPTVDVDRGCRIAEHIAGQAPESAHSRLGTHRKNSPHFGVGVVLHVSSIILQGKIT